MKLKEKMLNLIFVIVALSFSYYMCSTHELRHPGSIFNTRRNRFCAAPFWLIMLIPVIYIFVYL